MINARGMLVVAIASAALLLGARVRAEDHPILPQGVSCADVVHNVRKYGYWPAWLWAKANGFSDAQIREAKRCLRK